MSVRKISRVSSMGSVHKIYQSRIPRTKHTHFKPLHAPLVPELYTHV